MSRVSSPSFVPWLLVAVIAIIAWGSLYPFNFDATAVHGSLLEAMGKLTWARAGRGDRVLNVLLYLPLGFCLFLSLGPRRRWRSSAITVLCGAAFSFSIEVAQSYLPARVPSLIDLVLNTAGTLLGAIAGAMWRGLSALLRLPPQDAEQRRTPDALLLLLLWLAWRLAPFVPHFDLTKLKSALWPLAYPHIEPQSTLLYLTCWLIVTQALLRLVSRQKVLEALLTLIAVVMVGRLVVASQSFVPSELVAFVLLLPALILLTRLHTGPRHLLLFIAMGSVVYFEMMVPAEASNQGQSFDWLPFITWFDAGMPIDWVILFKKLFLFGALVWLFTEAGAPRGIAAVIVTTLVTMIQIIQQYLPDHAGTLTDPLLALAVGLLFRFFTPTPGPSTTPTLRSKVS
jgi:hypothetical protein